LKERYRKIKQLTKQYSIIQDEAKRQLEKQKLIEGDLTNGLVGTYMKEQRKTITEGRKAERELQLEREKKIAEREDALQKQLLDQIEMLKDEIRAAEQEETLIRKGEAEVYLRINF
jgi:hypothetical protein